jgi:hypothetical protein
MMIVLDGRKGVFGSAGEKTVQMPQYFIHAGLVFTTLTRQYLMSEVGSD